MAKTNPSNSKTGAFKEDDEDPPTSHFLGIGINAYEHFDGLNNAVKDVQDLARLLADRYGFSIDAERDLLLDKAASRLGILRAQERPDGLWRPE